MTTHFRRNDESPSEYRERVEIAEAHSGRWFADATKPQTAIYHQAMRDLRGLDAPRYDRARAAAEAAFTASTRAAAELCDLTFVELMATGEVSEALSYRWDELAVADAVSVAA